ncbi:hypothetical protein HQ393_13900 [Chitinibacter bivalviorum]|uniref:Uncharacterized protein n=1 Tax=Chitinibacter bivalviorum TaxID=2739434 RepID=A0A7H9BLK0_9NEIS|nr:hypothetical protein [Chitinibacter bivalviorum]QLG89246.1 hypothetical protein HQ393_13900 [Chitinibacter bivalviorum]
MNKDSLYLGLFLSIGALVILVMLQPPKSNVETRTVTNLPATASVAQLNDGQLIAAYQDADNSCRGTSDEVETPKYCAKRDSLAKTLEDKGYEFISHYELMNYAEEYETPEDVVKSNNFGGDSGWKTKEEASAIRAKYTEKRRAETAPKPDSLESKFKALELVSNLCREKLEQGEVDPESCKERVTIIHADMMMSLGNCRKSLIEEHKRKPDVTELNGSDILYIKESGSKNMSKHECTTATSIPTNYQVLRIYGAIVN